MDIFGAGMEPFFRQRLVRLEAELRARLDNSTKQLHEAAEAGPRGVVDFKDVAAEQSLATVDEAQADYSAHELEAVSGALRRLADHSYGQCADCGQAIDLARLMALPATPCCTACQAIREQDRTHQM